MHYMTKDEHHNSSSQEANVGFKGFQRRKELARKMSPKTQMRNYEQFKKKYNYK